MIGCIGNPSWWNNIPKEFKISRCYHTTWQSNSGMRFILLRKLEDNKVLLGTKYTTKTFTSNISDLRDINSYKNSLK